MFSLRRLLPRSLKGQLVLGFGLLGLLATLATSTALGLLLADKSRAESDLALNEVAHNAGRLLADGLFLRMREVQVLAASPTLWTDGLDSPRVRQVLLRSQELNAHAAWIGVARSDGTVAAATGQMLEGVDVSGRPWFQQAMKGAHIGDVHPAKLLAKMLPTAADGGPQRFVDFAAPIHVRDRVIGVLAIHGSWDWANYTIEQLLPATLDRKKLELFIFDSRGKMIYHPRRGGSLDQAQPIRTRRSHEADQGDVATVVSWDDGTLYRTVALPVEAKSTVSDLGWTIVARQPAAVTEAAATEAVTLSLFVGLFASAVAAGLGWVIGGLLTSNLSEMAVEARELTKANELRLPSLRGGSVEVTRLSHALRGLIRGLLDAKEDLEARVQQRTVELGEVNLSLRTRNAELGAVVESGLVGMARLRNRQAVWQNAEMARMFGYGLGELDGQNARVLYPSNESCEALGRKAHAALAEIGHFRTQWELVRKDGSPIWVDMSGTLLPSGETLWSMLDITESKLKQQATEQVAFHDALTGLPNRLLLRDRLEQALAACHRNDTSLAVCFIDLDGFKGVNDSLGHAAGDELLQQVAWRLTASVRASDTVARLGGDEFVLLLGDVGSEEECQAVVQRCIDALDEPFGLGEGEAVIGGSAGVAYYPTHGVGADALLHSADSGMYRAKQARKSLRTVKEVRPKLVAEVLF